MTKYKTHNDLVQAIATRARELALLPMFELRSCHPDALDSPRDVARISRASCIEAVLYEEFSLDFDRDLYGLC